MRFISSFVRISIGNKQIAMGLFDFFKKKPEYDVTNLKVTDLRKGFVFDYDLSTWIVKEEYEYDWGDEYFSYEFRVENESEAAFLSVEQDDELEISLSRKIRIHELSTDLAEQLRLNQKPPQSIVYNNVTYFQENEAPGYFRNVSKGGKQWEEFISWTYYPKEGKEIIIIEQWGETEFEASVGVMLKEFEISNIMPGS
jgi:hypothetical protein